MSVLLQPERHSLGVQSHQEVVSFSSVSKVSKYWLYYLPVLATNSSMTKS